MSLTPRPRPLPSAGARAVLAGGTLAGAWWVAWHGSDFGWLGDHTFFPLWLGYVVLVDALLEWRTGSSPLRRSPPRWLGMFVASVPAWWLFECLNRLLQNWHYVGVAWSPIMRHAHASLCFSTVVPAVFTTAALLHQVLPARLATRGPRVPDGRRALAAYTALGLLLLLGIVLRPAWLFPAAWLCVFLILDPLNHARGRPALLDGLRHGDWRLVCLLGASALVCGLFWELWNFHSSPKWVYTVSLAPFGLQDTLAERRVFEMPLLGYGGYMPFGLEVYALYQFLAGLVGRSSRTWLRFDAPGEANASVT